MSSRNLPHGVMNVRQLYQIGIRCLAATELLHVCQRQQLYQIGIRCLAATDFCEDCAKHAIISDWN